MEDHACSEKGDAADHLCRHTAGIGITPGDTQVHQIHKTVFRQDHDNSRRYGDDAVRADSGVLLAFGTLQSDEEAKQLHHKNTNEKFKVVADGQYRLRQIIGQSE